MGIVGRLAREPINLVLDHAPPTLDPHHLNLAALDFDEAEANMLDKIREHCEQRHILSMKKNGPNTSDKGLHRRVPQGIRVIDAVNLRATNATDLNKK